MTQGDTRAHWYDRPTRRSRDGVMDEPAYIEIVPTSGRSADVSPVCLRGGSEGNRTRLVFVPVLVKNPTNPDASVHGTFAYQRRGAAGQWEDISAIRLSELLAGEGVKLELRATEVLQLYNALSVMYENYQTQGIPQDKRQYRLVDSHSPDRQILDILSRTRNADGFMAVLDWFDSQDERIIADHFRNREEAARRLDSAIGVARLQRFIDEAEALLSDSREGDWQELFQRESWALAQAYAQPVVIISGQTYVGGKNIHNREGNIADFLYGNSLTDNCMIVEIKRSDTPLVVDDDTVRNNVMNVSRQVVGAVQQLLQNASSLARNYRELAGEDPEFQAFCPRLLLIVGSARNLKSSVERRSFEMYRGEQRNVEIVTFDELIEKARTLLRLLRTARNTE